MAIKVTHLAPQKNVNECKRFSLRRIPERRFAVRHFAPGFPRHLQVEVQGKQGQDKDPAPVRRGDRFFAKKKHFVTPILNGKRYS